MAVRRYSLLMFAAAAGLLLPACSSSSGADDGATTRAPASPETTAPATTRPVDATAAETSEPTDDSVAGAQEETTPETEPTEQPILDPAAAPDTFAPSELTKQGNEFWTSDAFPGKVETKPVDTPVGKATLHISQSDTDAYGVTTFELPPDTPFDIEAGLKGAITKAGGDPAKAEIAVSSEHYGYAQSLFEKGGVEVFVLSEMMVSDDGRTVVNVISVDGFNDAGEKLQNFVTSITPDAVKFAKALETRAF